MATETQDEFQMTATMPPSSSDDMNWKPEHYFSLTDILKDWMETLSQYNN